MKRHFIYLLALVIPVLFIFNPLFSFSTIAMGDAPHFVVNELVELYGEPFVWTSRGENLGGVDPRLWISPLLNVFGFLGSLGLSNEVLVRLLFYYPSLFLSLAGGFYFARYFSSDHRVHFFTTLFYTLNTYYILLVDGGQVGIALAYGIFPFAFVFLSKLLKKRSASTFFLTVFFLQFLFIADPRVALLAIVSVFSFSVLDYLFGDREAYEINGTIKILVLFSFSLLGLNAYWLVPLLTITQTSGSVQASLNEFVSLLHPLFTYQPHWPLNVFGEVVQPHWAFAGIPLLVFSSLLVKHKTKLPVIFLTLYLFFSFFAKGSTPPLGSLYKFIINTIPFASSFRDSSKFFIPLMLIAGFLLGKTVSYVVKQTKLGKPFEYGVYIYLIFLISPFLWGQRSFVLSGKVNELDISLHETIDNDSSSFFRTAWFPERHPLAYETNEKLALDAKGLVSLRPFARLNTGSFDKFNFLHSEQSYEWLSLLGTKYFVLSGDHRNPNPSEDEVELWLDLQDRVATSSALAKVDYGGSTPLYKLQETAPHVFSTNHLYAVVGADTVYDDFEGEIGSQAFVFFEDGLLDPTFLDTVATSAATIVFNEKSEDDLTMSLLQEYFLSSGDAKENEWASYSENDYLVWKYQMLIRDIAVTDFSYGEGILFSENKGEKITFRVHAADASDYIIAIRSFGDSDSKMSYSLENISDEIFSECNSQNDLALTTENIDTIALELKCDSNMKWTIEGITLSEGEHELVITNENGTSAVNVIAFFPASKWSKAQEKVREFTSRFDTLTKTELSKLKGTHTSAPVSYKMRYPVWYEIDPPKEAHWIIFTDSYHPEWQLKRGIEYFDSIPVYSSVNAFYVEPEWTNVSLHFRGQEKARWGVWISALFLLGNIMVFIWFFPVKNKRR